MKNEKMINDLYDKYWNSTGSGRSQDVYSGENLLAQKEKAIELRRKLEEALTDEQKIMLREYDDACNDQASLANLYFYELAFKSGARLALDQKSSKN